MNKIIRLLVACALFTKLSCAQTDTTIKYPQPRFIEPYVSGGGQFVNFSGLNGELSKAGIDKLISGMAGIGFGVAFNIHRLTAGIDATVMSGYQRDVAVASTMGHIYLAVNTIQSNSWALAPEVGINWQGTEVNITQPGTAGSFNDALTHAQNQLELHHNNTMVDAALVFKMRRFAPFAGNLGVKYAIRVGYRYGLGDNAWEIRRSAVGDAPKDRLSNFYLMLALGFGHK